MRVAEMVAGILKVQLEELSTQDVGVEPQDGGVCLFCL